MRFGASIWPWKWDKPYDDTIKRIGRAGFRATELIAWDDDAFTEYYTDQTVRELRPILDGRAWSCPSSWSRRRTCRSPDPALRAASVDLFKRGVEKTVAFGSPIINTVVHFPFAMPFPQLADRPLVQMFSQEVPRWPGLAAELRGLRRGAARVRPGGAGRWHPLQPGAPPVPVRREHRRPAAPARRGGFSRAGRQRRPQSPVPDGRPAARHGVPARRPGAALPLLGQRRRDQRPLASRHGQDQLAAPDARRWPTPGSTVSSPSNSRTSPGSRAAPGTRTAPITATTWRPTASRRST